MPDVTFRMTKQELEKLEKVFNMLAAEYPGLDKAALLEKLLERAMEKLEGNPKVLH